MRRVEELYYDANTYKYYDYPAKEVMENGRSFKHRHQRGWRLKPFKVHQADGSVKLAYLYGEQHFSYSEAERDEARKEHKNNA